VGGMLRERCPPTPAREGAAPWSRSPFGAHLRCMFLGLPPPQGAGLGAILARLTPRDVLRINPPCQQAPASLDDAAFDGGGVSRVAKGADCKSAGLRLRRFESYLPHQPALPAEARRAKSGCHCGE
jgi:hypothetical protein